MPNWTEFRLAVQGLLCLARLNPSFLRYFDRSPQGALRSFWLALPIYPFFLLQLWQSDALSHAPDAAQFFLAMSVGYLHLWLVPPLVITWIAPMIGRDAEMPGCIAVYNWQSVLNVGAALPLLLLQIGGVPSQNMGIPYDLLLVVSLVWEAFLLTHMLRIRLWQAALATAADYLVTHWVILTIFLVIGGVAAAD